MPKSDTASTTRHEPEASRSALHAEATGTSCARTNAGDNWQEISGNLPTDFGFVIDVGTRTNPRRSTLFLSRAMANTLSPKASCASTAAAPEATNGAAHQGPAAERLLRSMFCATRMAVDTLDKCGIYFGTSGGRSTRPPMRVTAGTPLCGIFRPVLSVEVQRGRSQAPGHQSVMAVFHDLE